MTQTAETPTGLDALPKKLSPSRAKDFEQCPYKFKQKVILHRREPNTAATTRGTIAHEALENLFKNHPQGERTVEAALQYVEPAWDGIKDKDNYKHLIPEQDDILDFARQCVQNYFTIENPNRFDPAGLEQYISTDLDDGLTVHGYIDRVDEITLPGKEVSFTYIGDYKTGKLPNPRYLNDAFFAMKLYALVLRETTGKTPYALRLVYIKHTGKEAVRFLKLTDEILDQTRAEIQGIWTRIKAAAAADNWPTKTGPLCNWCYFQDKGCPAFANKKSSK